jgi:hypothetical protein
VRTAAYLFLPAALALLGFGVWLLYARFVGGPDHYMGRPDETQLRDIEEAIAVARASRAESDAKAAELRKELDQAGAKVPDDLRARVQAMIETHEERSRTAAGLIERAEPLRDKLAAQRDREMEEARGRTLRRGILFTLVGLIGAAHCVDYLRRTRRQRSPEAS